MSATAGGVLFKPDARGLGDAMEAAGVGGKVAEALQNGTITVTVKVIGSDLTSWWKLGDATAAYVVSVFGTEIIYVSKEIMDVLKGSRSANDLSAREKGKLANEAWHAYNDQVVKKGNDPDMTKAIEDASQEIKGREVNRGGERGDGKDIIKDMGRFMDDYTSSLADNLVDRHGQLQDEVKKGRDPEQADKDWQDVLDGKDPFTQGIDADDGKGLATVPGPAPSGLIEEVAERFGLNGFK